MLPFIMNAKCTFDRMTGMARHTCIWYGLDDDEYTRNAT